MDELWLAPSVMEEAAIFVVVLLWLFDSIKNRCGARYVLKVEDDKE